MISTAARPPATSKARLLRLQDVRLARLLASLKWEDKLLGYRIRDTLQLLLRALFFIIFLLNIRAIPGGWHWRVFWPITKVRASYLFTKASSSLALTLAGKTGKAKREALEVRMEKWLDSITPVGSHPFEFQTVYRSWVSMDETDINMHMSNSSYPKALDCARTKTAMELLPQFLRIGGVIPLSAIHFHFIKELPMFSKYELRMSIGAWDEKWFYAIGRFISKASDGKASGSSHSTNSSSTQDNTPSHAELNGVDVAGDSVEQTRKADAAVFSQLVSSLGDKDVDNGQAILHTVCVSRVCFKLGRITVPPVILMATNGISVHPWELAGATSAAAQEKRYSRQDPPPTWTSDSQALLSKASGGSPRKLREFYKGKWRETRSTHLDVQDIPWWDRALGVGGIVDEKRKERLEICRGLVGGMEGAREMVH